MAVYRGRVVTVLGPNTADDAVPMYTILDDQGQRSDVRLNEISFTKEEQKELQKTGAERYNRINIIEDKDLQELQDSQDPDKIRERQKQEAQNQLVSPTTYVKKDEVLAQNTTPVMAEQRTDQNQVARTSAEAGTTADTNRISPVQR